MSEENISQERRLKNIDKTTNYLIKEVNQNELISKKHKKVYQIILNTFLFYLLELLDVFPFLLLLLSLVFLFYLVFL